MLWDVGDHARIEHTWAMVRGIKAGVAMQIGSFPIHTAPLGHPLQGVEPLRPQPQVRLLDGSPRQWRPHIAMVVSHGADVLPLLVRVTRVAHPLAPVFATVLGPSPWRMRTSRVFSAERCPTLALHACCREASAAPLAKAR